MTLSSDFIKEQGQSNPQVFKLSSFYVPEFAEMITTSKCSMTKIHSFELGVKADFGEAFGYIQVVSQGLQLGGFGKMCVQ